MSVHEAVTVDSTALHKYFALNAIEADEQDIELDTLRVEQGVNLNTFLRRVTGCYREVLSVPWMLIHITRCAIRYPNLSFVELINKINNHCDDFDFGITCDIMQLPLDAIVDAAHDSLVSLPGVGFATVAGAQAVLTSEAEEIPVSFSIGDRNDYVEKWNEESDRCLYALLNDLRTLEYSDDLFYLIAKVLFESGRVLVPTVYDIDLGRAVDQVRSVVSIESIGFNLQSAKSLLRYKVFNPTKMQYYGGYINDAGEWLPKGWEQWLGGLCLYTAVQHLMALSVGYSATWDCEQLLSDECADRFVWMQETIDQDLIQCEEYTFQRTPDIIFLRTTEEGFMFYTETKEITCTHKISKQVYDCLVAPVVRDCLM